MQAIPTPGSPAHLRGTAWQGSRLGHLGEGAKILLLALIFGLKCRPQLAP